MIKLRCVNCNYEMPPHPKIFRCPRCGGLLEVVLEPERKVEFDEIRKRGRIHGIWRFKEFLPVKSNNPVTMGEGSTPLIRVEKIEKKLGIRRVYVKFEGANPTGSFKDRGMSLAVTLAKEYKAKATVSASTGNTASSAAAYSARAGMKSLLVLPRGKVALGKLAQSILHGAEIIEIEGNFDVALEAAMKIAERDEFYPLNSFNPWRLEGQKTLAYEVFEEIGVPDAVVVPVGNAGNISAIWKGFKELNQWGYSKDLPVMYGIQAEGASPLASAFKAGLERPIFTENPETVATAIRIGKPVNWMKAMKAVRESGGAFESVSDEEILQAQRELARLEGIAAEPAGAASLAGLKKLVDKIGRDSTVVLVVTGHGLKDPDSAKFHKTKVHRAYDVEEAVNIALGALKVNVNV